LRDGRRRLWENILVCVHINRLPRAVFRAQGAADAAVIIHDAHFVDFHVLRPLYQIDAVYGTKNDAGFTACAPLHEDYGQLLGFLLTVRFVYSLSHLSLLKITLPNNTTSMLRARTQA